MASLSGTVKSMPPKGIWGALQALGYGLVDRPTTASYPGADVGSMGIERNVGQTLGELVRQGGMKLNNPQIGAEQQVPFQEQALSRQIQRQSLQKGAQYGQLDEESVAKYPELKKLNEYSKNFYSQLQNAQVWVQKKQGNEKAKDEAYNYLVTLYPDRASELKAVFYPKSNFWSLE